MVSTEERRDSNLHTIEELKSAGNKIVCGKPDDFTMSMRRGNTVTWYVRTGDYWKPIIAKTLN